MWSIISEECVSYVLLLAWMHDVANGLQHPQKAEQVGCCWYVGKTTSHAVITPEGI